ncbi:S1C family serine protease [Microbulbifer magnicolonia]|uniref:S1C family serine protease n=1 Tax=Microbulbifer magnicolonia TaxID=3109744 RepID=UPI002B40B382|nr:trypsin-like peptidase domain-containing protein [Microbulbifer sp. GG15]
MSPKRFLQDWAVPAGIGLAMAATLLLLFPQLRGGAPAPATDEWQGPVSYASAVRRAAPAVVNIYTRTPLANHPNSNNPLFRMLLERMNPLERQRLESNVGSGVVVGDDGYILTNHHVVNGVDEILVKLADGREAQAQLVGSDADFDLAVLKVDLPNLTSIKVGEPEKVQVGDVVLAIGNPFGVGQTVTQGIISATGERYLDLSSSGTGSYLQNFLQTDAAVNPGNSGGALVDAHGRLLGINTEIVSRTGYSGGIGFAIPANIAFKVMQDIIEYGRVVPGWLGIEASAVTPQLARAFRLPSTNGVIITAIYNQGPAHQAGLKPGDVITHIDGQPINDGKRGIATMATLRPGDTVSITFMRNGVANTVEATVSEKPKAQRRS